MPKPISEEAKTLIVQLLAEDDQTHRDIIDAVEAATGERISTKTVQRIRQRYVSDDYDNATIPGPEIAMDERDVLARFKLILDVLERSIYKLEQQLKTKSTVDPKTAQSLAKLTELYLTYVQGAQELAARLAPISVSVEVVLASDYAETIYEGDMTADHEDKLKQIIDQKFGTGEEEESVEEEDENEPIPDTDTDIADVGIEDYSDIGFGAPGTW